MATGLARVSPGVFTTLNLLLDLVVVAAALVGAALAHARAQGLRIRPQCSYVQVYMRRHPETQDLLAT